MRPGDITVPKPHHWGVLPSYREQDGGEGAATGRKGRIREGDDSGRKNAIMEHLVGLVQKR